RPLHRRDLPSGDRVRPAQREHPQDRRAHRGPLHRSAQEHLPAHAGGAAQMSGARSQARSSAVERAAPSSADARASLRTLRDLLRFAVSRFEAAGLAYGQGTDNARDEAAWLLLWSLHLPPDELDAWLDCRLTGAEIDAALALIERRCGDRVPAAWLTGEAWLRGLRFRCDARALVPRSLIAEALDESLADWLAEDLPEWLDAEVRPEDSPEGTTGGTTEGTSEGWP